MIRYSPTESAAILDTLGLEAGPDGDALIREIEGRLAEVSATVPATVPAIVESAAREQQLLGMIHAIESVQTAYAALSPAVEKAINTHLGVWPAAALVGSPLLNATPPKGAVFRELRLAVAMLWRPWDAIMLQLGKEVSERRPRAAVENCAIELVDVYRRATDKNPSRQYQYLQESQTPSAFARFVTACLEPRMLTPPTNFDSLVRSAIIWDQKDRSRTVEACIRLFTTVARSLQSRSQGRRTSGRETWQWLTRRLVGGGMDFPPDSLNQIVSRVRVPLLLARYLSDTAQPNGKQAAVDLRQIGNALASTDRDRRKWAEGAVEQLESTLRQWGRPKLIAPAGRAAVSPRLRLPSWPRIGRPPTSRSK